MGKCQSDRKAYVSRAAFEALPTARRIAAGKGFKTGKWRSVNRRLWSHDNGGVDVSLKDGLFSEIAQDSAYSNGYPGNPGINEFMKCEGDSNEEFTGFQQTNPKNGVSRSTTTSPWVSFTCTFGIIFLPI